VGLSDHTVFALTMVATWFAGGAVALAWTQIRISRQFAQTAFEDDLSREYRAIIGLLPAAAFQTNANETLLEDEETARGFYRYFDLNNEQLFLCPAWSREQ
jgi:hypothetical protein